ncbi:hypothetical protein [Nostoc sp. C052]|uniref:hypothetical protein n=1 Tax=Nostoc sp. C052 TaxID=2576902 RepID=UPI0015C3623B|nr:hypothetical protein [Nostoc sp. C052]
MNDQVGKAIATLGIGFIKRIFGVATVAGVEILRQRQLKDSVADFERVSERFEGHIFL